MRPFGWTNASSGAGPGGTELALEGGDGRSTAVQDMGAKMLALVLLFSTLGLAQDLTDISSIELPTGDAAMPALNKPLKLSDTKGAVCMTRGLGNAAADTAVGLVTGKACSGRAATKFDIVIRKSADGA